jgi:hypothetical protein
MNIMISNDKIIDNIRLYQGCMSIIWVDYKKDSIIALTYDDGRPGWFMYTYGDCNGNLPFDEEGSI